jgi:hypothetical protein
MVVAEGYSPCCNLELDEDRAGKPASAASILTLISIAMECAQS